MKKYLLFFVLSILILPISVHGKAIDKYIKDGKFVVKSVKPSEADFLYVVIEDIYPDSYENPNDNFTLGYSYYDEETHNYVTKNCNDDLTKCYFTENYNGETTSRELEIEYVYDEDIKKVVDNLVGKMPEGKDRYDLTDMEVIAFLYNDASHQEISNYSSDFKQYIDYMNFSIDTRYGDGDPFITLGGGNALFIYDGTVYYISDRPIEVFSRHKFYIPEDSTNVIDAMYTRLKKNFPNVNFEIREMTPQEYLDLYLDFMLEAEAEFYNSPSNDNSYYWEHIHNTYPTLDDYLNAMRAQDQSQIIQPLYLAEDGEYHDIMLEEKVYQVIINGKDNLQNAPLFFTVVKDDSKIKDNRFISTDNQSKITIKTSEAIPLDTLIKVSKITSGETYDRIVNLLSISNGEMFDLSLFSRTTGQNITKLDDGTFEVRIPISDSLKGKQLVVYYVDDSNNVTKYDVEIDGDYAVFKTNHFSIYTLAEDNSTTTEEPKINNPATLDNIPFYMGISIISFLGLTISIKKIKTN